MNDIDQLKKEFLRRRADISEFAEGFATMSDTALETAARETREAAELAEWRATCMETELTLRALRRALDDPFATKKETP